MAYRRILRGTVMIGGSSVFNVLSGMVRSKVIAVLLGPAGIGLVGLYQSLISTLGVIGGLGAGGVGARQIAEARANDSLRDLAAAREILFRTTLIQAAASALAVWLLRKQIASSFLGSEGQSAVVGWLALGVALTICAGAQGAFLQGMGRVRETAILSALSSLFYTFVAVGIALTWKLKGVVLLALAGPALTFVVGGWYISRSRMPRQPWLQLRELVQGWGALLKTGMAFMLVGAVGTALQLFLRIWVTRSLGESALGYFQAAATLGGTYLGFVLASMGTDYYPRLCEASGDHAQTNRLASQQTEVAMLIGTPAILFMLGGAPWLVQLLYSDKFIPAVAMLRWQLLGDTLKLASWPLSFLILATGDGRNFLMSEILGPAVVAIATVLLISNWGLSAVGFAYFLSYLIYLPTIYWLVARKTGFWWEANVLKIIGLSFGAASVVQISSSLNQLAGAFTGITMGVLSTIYSARSIGRIMGVSVSPRDLALRIFAALKT